MHFSFGVMSSRKNNLYAWNCGNNLCWIVRLTEKEILHCLGLVDVSSDVDIEWLRNDGKALRSCENPCSPRILWYGLERLPLRNQTFRDHAHNESYNSSDNRLCYYRFQWGYTNSKPINEWWRQLSFVWFWLRLEKFSANPRISDHCTKAK